MKFSEEKGNIIKAMLQVQKEAKGLQANTQNPFFRSKYITLDSILNFIKPILDKNNVWLIQDVCGNGKNIGVKTILMHETGEWAETEILYMAPKIKKEKDKATNEVIDIEGDPQLLGSCITYSKRYQLSSLLGICSEADDDGNKASGTLEIDEDKKITKTMAKELRDTMKSVEKLADKASLESIKDKMNEVWICSMRNKNSFEQLHTGEFVQVRDWLARELAKVNKILKEGEIND